MWLLKTTAGREQKERWKEDTSCCRGSCSVSCPQCWGLWRGDESTVMHPMLPAALAKVAKIPFLLSGSLLSRFSVRSEQVEFKALEEKKKGKALIARDSSAGAFRSALRMVQDSMCMTGTDPASATARGQMLEEGGKN